jgi:transcriptional regulator with XRE-family HTH domain
MSQRDLARELDVSQGWLSRALSGKRPLSSELLEQVARVLAVKPDHFIEYRRAASIQALKDDPVLVDQVFDQLRSVPGRGMRRKK